MSDMLTNEEMQEVYLWHEREGRAGDPYILHYTHEDAILTFFGSVHTGDIESSQWQALEKEWHSFVAHDNRQKIVLFEKAGSEIDGLSREQAIVEHGETGLVLWLAKQNGIQAESPQMGQAEQIDRLKADGFNDKDIMAYYFARQMHQWIRQDRKIAPSWRDYIEDTIRHYNALNCWQEEITFPKVLSWFEYAAGKKFDETDIKTFYDLSDPSKNPVSAASGKQQDIVLRDSIDEHLKSDQDVFVVYGSGHAIRLEPVLDHIYTALK